MKTTKVVRTSLALWALGLVMWSSGCSSEPGCVEGASQVCACADGRSGAQSCTSGAFAACVCTGGLDAAAADGEPTDLGRGDAMPDGGVARDAEEDAGFADARPDAAPDAAADAGPADTGLPEYCTRFPMGYSEIPAGTFFMGARPEDRPPQRIFDDEEPRHGVEITRAYWLKQTEVTQAEWEEIGPALPNPSARTGCPLCPVENVSWHEVVDWLNQLSRACGLIPCYPDTAAGRVGVTLDLDCPGFRLPTEAEWEYAARAGTLTNTYNGQSTITATATFSTVLDPIAWYNRDNMNPPSRSVGALRANAWQLRDMLGNVSEFVTDGPRVYADVPLLRDPQGPPLQGGAEPEQRVNRGGSAFLPPSGVRASYRPYSNGFGNPGIGFRIARTRR